MSLPRFLSIMEWETYSHKFQIRASEVGFTKEEITKCLDYAFNLFEKGIPIIYDQKHLSLLVGYNEEYLLRASNLARHFYRTFKIPKKNGGERIISEPLPSLKEIQNWILEEILYKLPVSKFAKAYVPKRSIKENARFHRKQKIVLTIDIMDFFGSIHYGKVFTFFLKLGYSKSVSTMLANLCSLENSLPQGAPTSPALSNLLIPRVDKRISGFTQKHKIRYTRYADDMTFSGDFEPGMMIKFVERVLDDENLKINEKKIRVRKPHQRQEVTGIVVNQKLQAPRELRRKLRQEVYYIEKYGLASHLQKLENQRANYLEHLLGITNHILFVNPNDEEVRQYRDKLREYIIIKRREI